MSCIDEKTCDIVATFWHLPIFSAQNIVPPRYALVSHFATECTAVKFKVP